MKKWQEADQRTWYIMFFIANREGERYLDYPQIENFSCPVLKQIDNYWVQNSEGHFGFSVQKKIWVNTGNRLGIKPEVQNENDLKNYIRFASAVGWYNDKKDNETEFDVSRLWMLRGWMRRDEIVKRIKKNPKDPSVRGGMPTPVGMDVIRVGMKGTGGGDILTGQGVFSRTATCKL